MVWFRDTAMTAIEKPLAYEEAMNGNEKNICNNSIHEELISININSTWVEEDVTP